MSELLSEAGAADAGAEQAAPAADPALESLADGDAAGAVADGAEQAAPAAALEQPAVDPAELQAQIEYLQNQQSELVNYLEQFGQQQPQQQPPAAPGQGLDIAGLTDEFGQITPEGLVQLLAVQQQSITQAIEQRFQQFTQPFEQQRVEQAYTEGLASAKDILGDNVARFGEFASDPQADEIARDRVLDRADAILTEPDFQQRYGGNTPRAAEIAIQRAAEEERQYLNSVRGQGAAQAANRLATLAGAAGEPGAGANGAIGGQPEFKSPREVVEFYAQQARQLDQQGGTAA